jgi:putative ABC transport system ATP-binding protein
MHILGCMDLPTSGRYVFSGADITRASADEVAAIRGRSIGFVFQSFHLIPRMTAVENVELPLLYARRSDHRERALMALERVGLAERGSHLPTELSGGQKQRVAIARALVTSPPLLLADEPTGALDSATGRDVMHLMETLLDDGATLILITHDTSLAKRAQRLILLRDGRIAADGPIVPPSRHG